MQEQCNQNDKRVQEWRRFNAKAIIAYFDLQLKIYAIQWKHPI